MKTLPILIFALVLLAGCLKESHEPGNLVPKTVDQDTTLTSINVNGTLLHTETFGNRDSSMVVFLHGGPGSDYRNGLNVQGLANHGFYVVFYDQRGTGLSQRHNKDNFTIQSYLDDLSAVVEHYRTSQNQKIFLFGHSWGAMLTAAYINTYPDKIHGAILAEPGGLSKELLDEYAETSRKLELFAEATNDVLYAEQFLSSNEHELLDYKMGLQSPFSYTKNNNEGIEGPSPFWRNGAVSLNGMVEIAEEDGFDFTTHLDAYNTKVLFIYGENNKSYGESFALKEASYFPNYELTQINDTGHEMIYFQWDQVLTVVLPYLNALK